MKKVLAGNKPGQNQPNKGQQEIPAKKFPDPNADEPHDNSEKKYC